jgi:hypothetical protein
MPGIVGHTASSTLFFAHRHRFGYCILGIVSPSLQATGAAVERPPMNKPASMVQAAREEQWENSND